MSAQDGWLIDFESKICPSFNPAFSVLVIFEGRGSLLVYLFFLIYFWLLILEGRFVVFPFAEEFVSLWLYVDFCAGYELLDYILDWLVTSF